MLVPASRERCSSLRCFWLQYGQQTEPEPCSNGGNIARRTSEELDEVLDGCETLINSDPTTLVLVVRLIWLALRSCIGRRFTLSELHPPVLINVLHMYGTVIRSLSELHPPVLINDLHMYVRQ